MQRSLLGENLYASVAGTGQKSPKNKAAVGLLVAQHIAPQILRAGGVEIHA